MKSAVAARADVPTARPRNSNESVMNQSSSCGMPASVLRVAQHAALQVTQAPAELALVAIAALRLAGRRRGADGRHRRFGNTRRVGRSPLGAA